MVRLSGQSLNALFDELSDWNHQLLHCDGLKEALAAIEDDADHVGAFNDVAAPIRAPKGASAAPKVSP